MILCRCEWKRSHPSPHWTGPCRRLCDDTRPCQLGSLTFLGSHVLGPGGALASGMGQSWGGWHTQEAAVRLPWLLCRWWCERPGTGWWLASCLAAGVSQEDKAWWQTEGRGRQRAQILEKGLRYFKRLPSSPTCLDILRTLAFPTSSAFVPLGRTLGYLEGSNPQILS